MTVLRKLTYRNFFLFENLEFEPSNGLNVITGESGAGKSLFLDGLNLLLGSRLDSNLIAGLKDKTVLEGVFEVNSNIAVNEFLHENDLDVSSELIIRREIAANGKNRCFVNDTPVSVQILKELGEQLCEIHSQHATAFIKSNHYQIDLLDNYSKAFELRYAYKETFQEIKKSQTQLIELQTKQSDRVKEQDYQSYLLDELIKADLSDINEENILEEEQSLLANASEIVNLTEAIRFAVNGEEQSVEHIIIEVRNQLRNLAQLSHTFEDDYQRFESAWIELNEIVKDVSKKGEHIQIDPQKLTEIEDRLGLMQNLKRKHNVTSLAELKEIQNQLAHDLQGFASLESEIEELKSNIKELEIKISKQAQELSSIRKRHYEELSLKIVKILTELEIPSAVFKIKIEPLTRDNWTIMGADKVSFLFSANAGVEPQILENIASGGELSRLMLSFKAISNGEQFLTVFDEIDTGVSGETAMRVGKLIGQMGATSQMLVITHLPQVASNGQSHFLINKMTENEKSSSQLIKLSGKERVLEIARLLSGKVPGEKAIRNAEELLAIN
ncbi:MAG: DNA repair protein RecN [Bacteroidetes bacterium]|nr:DNA repair protein RecN [Bacteroidota bacterium]